MKAQEELQEILIDKAKIDSKLEQLERAQSLAERVTSVMEGEVVSRSRDNKSAQQIFVEAKEALEKELVQLQKIHDKRKAFLSGCIDELKKPEHIKILYSLYFSGKELEQVAEEVGYTYRHVQNLRDDAIQAVQKIMDRRKSFHNFS